MAPDAHPALIHGQKNAFSRFLRRRFVSVGVHEHAGRDCNEAWIGSIARALRQGGIIGCYHITFVKGDSADLAAPL